MSKESALNTFDVSLAESYVQAGWERLETLGVVHRRLEDILDEHLPPGMEMNVLLSNNWKKYVPRYLMIEVLDTPLPEILNVPVIEFLRELGYVPVSKLVQTVILQYKG